MKRIAAASPLAAARAQRGRFRTVTNQSGRQQAPLAVQRSDGVDQRVDALHRPEFADEHDVARVRRRDDRCEFATADAVVHDAHQPARRADLAAKDVGAVGALEQIKIAAGHQRAFHQQIRLARKLRVIEQQAAAVRRIGAHDRPADESETRGGAAFGAVPMHHVGVDLPQTPADMRDGAEIARTELPRDRHAGDAQR
jgi:hypothetical protein